MRRTNPQQKIESQGKAEDPSLTGRCPAEWQREPGIAVNVRAAWAWLEGRKGAAAIAKSASCRQQDETNVTMDCLLQLQVG